MGGKKWAEGLTLLEAVPFLPLRRALELWYLPGPAGLLLPRGQDVLKPSLLLLQISYEREGGERQGIGGKEGEGSGGGEEREEEGEREEVFQELLEQEQDVNKSNVTEGFTPIELHISQPTTLKD